MEKIPLSESISLKQKLLREFGGDIVVLGFTFHFLSSEKVNLETFSGHLSGSGFEFARIVNVAGKEDFILEVTKNGDGDISYLMQMETILTELCFPYEDVIYLGATPIAEMKRGSGIKS